MKLHSKFSRIALPITAIGALMAGGLFMFLKFYEPDRERFPVRGIDVSHHQGEIEWNRVFSDDVSFVYLKASEGGDFRDRLFDRNVAEATQTGMPVGAYHFFTFCRPGRDQAENFIDATRGKKLHLPPVVDLEFVGNCAHRPTPGELEAELSDYLGIVEDAVGQSVMYYVTSEFLDDYGDVLPERLIWIRSIGRQPRLVGWTIWQFSGFGRVAGIEGEVDLNVLSGELAELKQN